jgi:hypothetical protein
MPNLDSVCLPNARTITATALQHPDSKFVYIWVIVCRHIALPVTEGLPPAAEEFASSAGSAAYR